MSFLSKKYGLLPCFCDHNPIQLKKHDEASILSKSSNAFWHRNNKLKAKLVTNNQKQNNSVASETNSSRSRNFQKFRKSIVQRFKRNNKRKMPTITARSVIQKQKNTNVITTDPPIDISNTMQADVNLPTLPEYDSEHSSYDSHRLASQDISYDNNEEDDNDTLEPTISSFTTEQQNINATNNTSRTVQKTSQTIINNLKPLRKTKRTVGKNPNGRRNTSSRSTISSSKRKKSSKPKRISKRKTSLSNKKIISASKRKNSTAPRTTYRPSPFPNPEMFHSIPQMQNS